MSQWRKTRKSAVEWVRKRFPTRESAVKWGRDRFPSWRSWMWQRRAAWAFLALASITGWIALSSSQPPREKGLANPAIGVAMAGLPLANGGVAIADLPVTIAPRAPRLTGCNPIVRVALRLQVSDPSATEAIPVEARRAAERPIRVAIAIAHTSVSRSATALRLGVKPGTEPSFREESVHRFPRVQSPSIDGAVFQGVISTRRTWTITFSARLGHRRGIGSCWIRLPSLMGTSAAAAASEAERTLWTQGYLDGDDAQLQFARHTVSELDNALVDTTASDPEPDATGSTWTCERPAQGRPLLTGCSAWAAVASPASQSWRDIALVLCGAFISLGMELLVRERKHAKGPTPQR